MTVPAVVLSDRERQVLALLRCLTDDVPGVVTSSGAIARGAQPGEVASRSVRCPRCMGDGTVPQRKERVPCPECGGDRRVLVDAVTGRRGGSRSGECHVLSGSERQVWRAVTDAKIGRLEAETRVREGSESADDLWTRAYDRADRLAELGSFRELHAALEILRDQAPMFASGLMRFVVYDPETAIETRPPVLQSSLQVALGFLERRMPKRIRVPGYARWDEDERAKYWRLRSRWLHWSKGAMADRGRAERAEHVRLLAAAGKTADEIAPLVGVGARQVRRILRSISDRNGNGEEDAA